MSLSRRAFLRRAGGAALALPLLQLPRFARAGTGEGYPTRLIIFYQPNGTKMELWRPPAGATETQFTLGPLLQPLAHHHDALVLLDGVDMKVADLGPGGPHQRGMASALTGEIITEGDFIGGDGRRAGWAGGPSIDQFAAATLQPNTALTTLEIGIRSMEAVPRGRIIYRGREQPVPPENDPVRVYDRAFGGAMAVDPTDARYRLLRRQSVLDSVAADFADLKARVTREDMVKLEQHADALRDLERRLGAIATRPDGCRPPEPRQLDVFDEQHFAEVARAQIDRTVAALACDVTRFASIQCSTAVNALRPLFLGIDNYQGHSLSHAGDAISSMQVQWERVLLWYSSQFAYLLDSLAAVPEGDGTLLDHSLVLWFSEISRGNSHNLGEIPFVLAGGANGRLRTGRYLRYDGASHNDLLVAVLHLLGVEVPTFGYPELCTGPLTGLL